MGLWILQDADLGRAVLYDSTRERALPCEAFIGSDAQAQAEDFLAWFKSLDLEVGDDPRVLEPRELDQFLTVWHKVAFDAAEDFVGAAA